MRLDYRFVHGGALSVLATQGLSVLHFSEVSGVSLRTIRNMLHGATFRAETLRRFLEPTNWTPSELIKLGWLEEVLGAGISREGCTDRSSRHAQS